MKEQNEEAAIIRIARAIDEAGYEIRSFKPAMDITGGGGELIALEIAPKQAEVKRELQGK